MAATNEDALTRLSMFAAAQVSSRNQHDNL